MTQEQKKYHKKHANITFFFLAFFCMKIYCMEEPAPTFGDQAKYYIDMLSKYDRKSDESKQNFNITLKKIQQEINTKDAFDRLQIYCTMIQQAVREKMQYLTNTLCTRLIALYQNQLEKNNPYQAEALNAIKKILEYEATLPCRGFTRIRKQIVFTQPPPNYWQEKEEKQIAQPNLYDSKVIDDKALSEVLFSFLNNWPESRSSFEELLSQFSPDTQFNLLELSIKTILDDTTQEEKKVLLANELYERLHLVYICLPNARYKKRFEALAKENSSLQSIKSESEVPLETVIPISLNQFRFKEFLVVPMQSPRLSRHLTATKKGTVDWQRPADYTVTEDTSLLFLLRGYLMALCPEGFINCYKKSNGHYVKTLQFPGKYPLAVTEKILPEISSKEIQMSLVEVEGSHLSIIHSSQKRPPICIIALFKDSTHIVYGNKNGSLGIYESTKETEGKALHYDFNEKHTAPITALQALNEKTLYSAAKDGSIIKWDLQKKERRGSLELGDPVRYLVFWRGNPIALVGSQSLVQFVIEENRKSSLTVYQEEQTAITGLTTFHNDDYLVIGCKNGACKIFNKGFNTAKIITPQEECPIKALFTIDDHTLITQNVPTKIIQKKASTDDNILPLKKEKQVKRGQKVMIFS